MQTREQRQAKLNRHRTLVRDLKATNPCADCGLFFPWYVMEFDHAHGEKSERKRTVANMAGRGSTSALLAEIEKCDIVCANCHKERTHRRKDGPEVWT